MTLTYIPPAGSLAEHVTLAYRTTFADRVVWNVFPVGSVGLMDGAESFCIVSICRHVLHGPCKWFTRAEYYAPTGRCAFLDVSTMLMVSVASIRRYLLGETADMERDVPPPHVGMSAYYTLVAFREAQARERVEVVAPEIL